MVYKLITSTYSVLMSKKIFAHKTTFPTTRIGVAGVWLAVLDEQRWHRVRGERRGDYNFR